MSSFVSTAVLLCLAFTCVFAALPSKSSFVVENLPGTENLDLTNQYAGFLTVNETANANIFFWFFESQGNPSTDPLLLWMTGGPGCASELALFYENGPLEMSTDLPTSTNISAREYAWNKNANLLYVDQPVGTGFSTSRVDGYVHTEAAMAQDMYTFLQQFIAIFNEYKGRDFFIFAESYGGHYAPALAYRIYQGNLNLQPGDVNIPLQAVGVGNGMTNPVVQYGQYTNYGYSHGLIGKQTKDRLDKFYPKCEAVIAAGDYRGAYLACNPILEGVSVEMGPLNTYDIRKTCLPGSSLCYNFDAVEIYLNEPSVQEALHVAGTNKRNWTTCATLPHLTLTDDWFVSVAEVIPDMLAAGIRFYIYNGDQDFIVNFLGSEAWVLDLDWPHKNDFYSAKHEVWSVDDLVAGHVQSSNGLSMIVVGSAGHMVPMDQPKNAFDLLTRVLTNQTFSS